MLYLTAGDGTIRDCSHDVQITDYIIYDKSSPAYAICSLTLYVVQWQSLTADWLDEVHIQIVGQDCRTTGNMEAIRAATANKGMRN
jgi:hypothetical protein